MKQSLKMIITLVIIASLSGAILAKVYDATKPEIEAKNQEKLEGAIFSVVPDAKNYTSRISNGIKVYECFNKDSELCGVAFTADGAGYQDVIKIMVGLDEDLDKITGIKIVEDNETPGLGGRINEGWFQDQFEKKAADVKMIAVKKQPTKEDEIQAITGATISSKAVVEIINKKVKKIKQVYNQ